MRNRTLAARGDVDLVQALTRRGLLLLIGAGAAWWWSAQFALGQTLLAQTEVDDNGRPIRLPGETPTPETKAREREAVEHSRDRVIDNRAQERTLMMDQQQQNDRAAAQQREFQVQQNFQQQQLDILNNRDKP